MTTNKPNDSTGKRSNAHHILAQVRHVQHHVGQLNGILKHKTGETPGWVGFNE